MSRLLMASVLMLVPLTGCGSEDGAPGSGAAEPTLPAAPPPTVAAEPVWPPAGCRSMSHGFFDFAADGVGEADPEQVALARDEAATSAVRRGRTWFLLDETGTAFARLGLIEAGGGGWRVNSDERCAD